MAALPILMPVAERSADLSSNPDEGRAVAVALGIVGEGRARGKLHGIVEFIRVSRVKLYAAFLDFLYRLKKKRGANGTHRFGRSAGALFACRRAVES